jgi:hypothetical protein
MATPIIEDDVLREILEAFVEGKKLPSAQAVSQLAKATGFSIQKLKDEFTEVYRDIGLSDRDPWSEKGD